MKNIIVLIVMGLSNYCSMQAQQTNSSDVFVWVCSGENNQTANLVNTFTTDFEALLPEMGWAYIKNAETKQLIETTTPESVLTSNGGLSGDIASKLKTLGVDALLFSKCYLSNGADIRLELTFFNSKNTANPITKSISFSELEFNKVEYRRNKLLRHIKEVERTTVSINTINRAQPVQSSGSIDNELLLWQKFARRPTLKRARNYISKYPDGKFLGDIEALLQGECAAKSKNKSCQTYLRLFPNGAYATEATSIIHHKNTGRNSSREYEYTETKPLSYPKLSHSPKKKTSVTKKEPKKVRKPVERNRAAAKGTNSKGTKESKSPTKHPTSDKPKSAKQSNSSKNNKKKN